MPRLRMRSGSRSTQTSRMKAPPHPFPELQGPFEESMTELERHEEAEVPSDAASRRTILLDAPAYQRVIAGRWKQRPGEKYHPLWKIAAQLSFGIHLLAENLAKSEEEVMQILQGHIDEIDLFLERTAEDFALAQDDIQERMRCLQLPLQHPVVFDRMLEDRAFRNSIVEGNEKIEHIVSRTQSAMRDSLKDAQKGLDATSSLAQYLASLEVSWGRRNADHEAVYEAMLENVEGWRAAFIDLHAQGDRLGRLLKELTGVINQMQQRAGEVSRRLARAQQKHGHSPSGSNITYISARQSTSSSGTRSATPVKPLPGVPNRDSARHSSRQSHRCETAQSTRSVTSQRSADVHKSRTSSREGHHSSVRDSANSRLNPKSPRIVEIKRQIAQGRESQQSASHVHHDLSKTAAANVATVKATPVELPAEIPRRTESNTHSRIATSGLGITQSEPVEIGDNPHGLTPILIGSLKDSAGTSGLPMTPKSLNSNGESNQTIAHELPSESSASARASAPSLTSSKPIGDPSLGSPPNTPGWAKQTFDSTERDRIVTGKTPFRSHPPNAELGSPPTMHSTRSDTQTQHTRFNESIASSLGAPGPEISSTAQSSPVKPRSVDGASGSSSVTGAVHSLTYATSTKTSSSYHGVKGFVAELEGITPITRHVAGYTNGVTRAAPREIVTEAVELEVPQHLQQSLFAIQETTANESSNLTIHKLQTEEIHGPETATSVSQPIVSPLEEGSVERRVAEAIRKSFIATNIELADTSISIVNITSAAKVEENGKEEKEEKVEDHSSEDFHRTSSKGVDDIIEQLERLNATSPNLSLRGEELLTTLPSTTYVAKQKPAQQVISNASTPNLSNRVASPESPTVRSESGTPKSRSGRSLRNSLASTASSQSQWRAFFKGQLSPADFNNSTPNLPGKANSTHKAIVDLQRRGQESSPTLGWQWAPETPNIAAEEDMKTPQL